MPIDKAVIPAAGLGTRMFPATKSQPKEMLTVGRKPVIQYVYEELISAGIKKILIITGQKKRAIEDHFDRDPNLIEHLLKKKSHDILKTLDFEVADVQLFYTRQSEQKGTAHAISLAERFADGEPFVVCLGDSIIKSSQPGSLVRRLIETHERKNSAVTIAFREVPIEDVTKYGIAVPDPNSELESEFKLIDLVEKPPIDKAPSRLAISARYVFSPEIFDAIRKTPLKNDEYQITDSIKILMDKHEVWGVKLNSDEVRYDVGSFKSYFEAFLTFALEDEEYGQAFQEYAISLLNSGTKGKER